MAFGSLGGLGGFAPSFPQRFGAPISSPVQSDQEWGSDWQNRLASVPQTISEVTRQDPGAPWWQEANAANLVPGGTDRERAAALSSEQMANSYGLTLTNMGDGRITLGRAADLPMQPSYETRSWANPEFERMQQQFQDAARMRGETQTRNQQGYDSMMGGNQFNAVLGPDYANEGFGQISGQGPTQMPQVDGVNMDWASGIYDPNYASGMFGNTGRRKQGWL